jgi:dimethylhistidine N-methyltransferase
MQKNISNSEALIKDQLVSEIESGLLATNAYISPKFLYDPLGSHLFTAITFLPEYYPTAIEKMIFNQFQKEIAQTVGSNGVLIDLGAGNCEKAKALFPTIHPSHYIAIDFSVEYLNDSVTKLQAEFPNIQMSSIGMDFSKNLMIPASVPSNRTFFYPGSSLGNFLYEEAQTFLTQIKSQLGEGGLLIGIDLMKSEDILIPAYDDPLKITAAFNLNILRSVNTIIGSNFDVSKFSHQVKVNHIANRVELYLESLETHSVSWFGHERIFQKGELIHTENSHKYTVGSMKQLLNQSGFTFTNFWTDPDEYFAVIYAR